MLFNFPRRGYNRPPLSPCCTFIKKFHKTGGRFSRIATTIKAAIIFRRRFSAEIGVTIGLLAINISFSTIDLSLRTPRLPTSIKVGSRHKVATQHAGPGSRAQRGFIYAAYEVSIRKAERTRAARQAAPRRPFAAVVRPAGNFVVRQLKVSRGNSRTNRWNGRRRPSGASRRATSFVCMAEDAGMRVCVY